MASRLEPNYFRVTVRRTEEDDEFGQPIVTHNAWQALINLCKEKIAKNLQADIDSFKIQQDEIRNPAYLASGDDADAISWKMNRIIWMSDHSKRVKKKTWDRALDGL